MTSSLVVVDLYPSLLQPEGDHGNAVALVHRARLRGADAELVVLHPGDELPRADVITIGGSIDVDLPTCARLLHESGWLREQWEGGAVVLGVGGGFCVIAQSFALTDGASESTTHRAAGLLDVHVEAAPLASGPVVTAPNRALGLPSLSGYEFHAARAIRAAGVAPFAELEVGVGDRLVGQQTPSVEGAVADRVIGTWLHGPLLPRNPEVTDLMLNWLDRDLPKIAADVDELAASVRSVRIQQARLNT